jgi:hypothetical protein
MEDQRALAVREGFSRPDFTIMSYDRLTTSSLGSMDITVRVVGRRFEAVAFSPTFKIGPMVVEDIEVLGQKFDALDRSDMPQARRRFLKRRIPYWEERVRRTRIRPNVWE